MSRYSNEALSNAIANSTSWRQTAIALGLHGQSSGNRRTLQRKADNLNFDYSHFTGQSWSKGKTLQSHKTMPLDEWLALPWMTSSKIKARLLKENLIINHCYECGLENEWCGKPIVLQLDHIDGDNTNNTLSNFRLLCPNCHSQTPTFVGKHKRKKQT